MKSTTKEHKKALEKLIMIGKDKGYLTYAELNDLLPEDLLTQDQIEPIVTILEELDIVVSEVIPDADTLVVESGAKAQSTSAEAAVAALAALDSEFGRTTDPVRMYMREMGVVDLLEQEDEIRIAKEIESGIFEIMQAITHYPSITEHFFKSLPQGQYIPFLPYLHIHHHQTRLHQRLLFSWQNLVHRFGSQ
jgi:RNA polymerase primary sigma factor